MSAPFDTVREVVDALHLQAHEGGPTTDLSTHFRRAERLWDAQRDDQEAAGFTDWVTPWADMNQAERLALAGFVARAVQDVLEVEQVMYLALVRVIGLADEKRAVAIDLAGSTRAKDLYWAAGLSEVVENVERAVLAALGGDSTPAPNPKDGRA